jgi:hypothetical protein
MMLPLAKMLLWYLVSVSLARDIAPPLMLERVPSPQYFQAPSHVDKFPLAVTGYLVCLENSSPTLFKMLPTEDTSLMDVSSNSHPISSNVVTVENKKSIFENDLSKLKPPLSQTSASSCRQSFKS